MIAGADLLLYVVNPHEANGRDEAEIVKLRKGRKPVVVVATHADHAMEQEGGIAWDHHVSATRGDGVGALREALSEILTRRRADDQTLLRGVVEASKLIMLIVPIDLEAPAGRLILPQVQTIREVLDSDAATVVVKETEVPWILDRLVTPPDLAITDSQVVLKAANLVPNHIPLTTFSILFSRFKGDLPLFVRNVTIIDELTDGDRVLITEACSHHTNCDDIGRVKIPRWLRGYTGKELEIDVAGGTFPEHPEGYRLAIHCGGCMITRNQMLSRLDETDAVGVPVTNYGVAISHLHGVLPRVIKPFGLTMAPTKKR